MGSDNIKAVSDNGIQNLSRSDILTIQFNKESYYEGQTVEGTIILEPKQNLVMNDILIKFKQSEYFVYVVDENNTISDINSQMFFEKRINAGEYMNMGSQMISLTPGSYKFPFQFTLPKDIPPSFEYPFRNRRASLRYTFSAELLSPYVKSLSETYMWIKARPINIPSAIKHENYVKVKNVGILSRGQSGVALFTMANNFRINDMLPFTVDIYNEECAIRVTGVKISIKRIVTFMKGGKEYQKRTAILRKRYPCMCEKNSKNSFHYDDIQIRDNDLKDIDFNKSLNPYPFIDDVNLLMPNIKTNLIKCEYSLKATSYFDYSVLEKNRPRVEMPIYVTHQLQREYEYEKDTNQNNGQGQEFAQRDFNRGFNNYGSNNNNNNNWGNNKDNYGGNNNNSNNWGNNNNNNFGGNNNNNNSWGNNNNNNYGGNNNNNNNWGNNNNNYGGNNNNDNNNKSTSTSASTSLGKSQKFSYEAYIATKKMNNPNSSNNNNNKYNNNDSWKSNNNDSWKSNNNYGNNNNNNWGSNNYGGNNDNYGSNNNNWGNNNNNYGNNNNNWGNNNNNYGNNNNNYGGSNYNPGSYGGGYNGSANPFGGGSNDFPSFDNINNNNNSSQPSNPFGNNNNNGPSNPFDSPSNPFGDNNNNNGNPSNPFGGSGSGSGPYQASYPGF